MSRIQRWVASEKPLKTTKIIDNIYYYHECADYYFDKLYMGLTSFILEKLYPTVSQNVLTESGTNIAASPIIVNYRKI